MSNTSVAYGGQFFPVIQKGRGRAFVYSPGGALIGCVENTDDYRWKGQLSGDADYIDGHWSTRSDAAVGLVRRALAPKTQELAT